MIVDDESIFREHLLKLFKWENYGFSVVCEAKNGLDALEKMKMYNINIALIDICMPLMDGIELSKQLRNINPKIEIIIITGHSEFEYAKQAIKLGVFDYILKPFEKEELILTLLKVKKKLEAFIHIKKIEKEYKENLKENLLNDLVLGIQEEDEAKILKQLKDCGIGLRTDIFKVITIEIDQIDQKWEELKERLLWKNAVVNIWDELSEEEYYTYTFYGSEDRIISIIELEKGQEIDLDVYYKLCDLINKYLKFSVTIGVGNKYKGLRNIEKSYQESLVALHNKYILENQNIIIYDNLELGHSNIGFYSMFMNRDILVHLRMNEWKEIYKKLYMTQKYIIDNNLSMDYVYVIYMGFISLCLSYVAEQGENIEEVFGEDFYPFTELKIKKSISSLNSWIIELFKKVIFYNQIKKNTKSRKIALSAKKYIEENYDDVELSVEYIANNLYISSSYLRSVFKKEIGLQISKYILNIRMEKAKELLQKEYIKITDIASMVGYSDPSYFSKVFKKYFGISPSEYENIHK